MPITESAVLHPFFAPQGRSRPVDLGVEDYIVQPLGHIFSIPEMTMGSLVTPIFQRLGVMVRPLSVSITSHQKKNVCNKMI